MSPPTVAPPVTALPATLNIHQISTFIPVYDGSYPIQDFLQEVSEAKTLGTWPDVVALKVAKSKLQGSVAELVRNRHDLNSAPSFDEFCTRLTSAINSDRPVSSRLQDLMTCVQHPAETVDQYACRIRSKSKALTEWDATAETQQLKNRTVSAAFVKGLKPSLRQFVLPQNPPDFDSAITLARTQELNSTLLPSTVPDLTPAVSAAQSLPDVALQEIKKRVASLELSAVTGQGQSLFTPRGRGRYNRGRWYNQPRRGRGSFNSVPPSNTNRHDASHQSYQDYRSCSPYRAPSRCSDSCRCCSCSRHRDYSSHHRDHSRYRSPFRDHNRRPSRSPSRERRYVSSRSQSRSPDRFHSDGFRRYKSPLPNGSHSRR